MPSEIFGTESISGTALIQLLGASPHDRDVTIETDATTYSVALATYPIAAQADGYLMQNDVLRFILARGQALYALMVGKVILGVQATPLDEPVSPP